MSSLKQGMRYALTAELVPRTAEILKPHFVSGSLIVPVPTSRKRIRERGFNQTVVLAKRIQSEFGVPYLELLSKKSESQQTGKGKHDRENIDPTLFITTSKLNGISKETHLILLDDVCTTGTTLHTCASTLETHGFTNIHAIAFFRGEPLYRKARNILQPAGRTGAARASAR